jgi:hypothetical protein
VTLTALVVDPTDPDLEGVEHTWELLLPDDFEGAEQLEALLPEGPYGTTLELDLASLFGARETTWTQGLIPFQYTVENDELKREAVKFAYFLVPEFDLGDDDDSGADDDDSAGPVGPPPPVEEELPEEYNENPTLTSLTIGTTTFSAEAGTLPGPGAPLYVGEIDPEEGLRFEIVVADDKDTDNVSAEVYWTHGSPGLPSDSPLDDFRPGDDDDDDDDDPADGGFGGQSASLNEQFFTPDREFGWTPPDDPPTDVPMRLFLILIDDDAGQSWQEIRPEAEPE